MVPVGACRFRRSRNILALNCGSSSLKFGLYRVGASGTEMLLTGEAESIGEQAAAFHVEDSRNETLPVRTRTGCRSAGCHYPHRELLADRGIDSDAVGHRVVHGGPKLRRHCPIDEAVFAELEAAAAFAPLHTPSALAVCASRNSIFPTSAGGSVSTRRFDADLPDIARVLPIPRQSAIGRNPALRLPWTVLRIDPASARRQSAGPADHRPSRQRRQHHCGQGRQIDRYQHGPDPIGGRTDGHAKRRS